MHTIVRLITTNFHQGWVAHQLITRYRGKQAKSIQTTQELWLQNGRKSTSRFFYIPEAQIPKDLESGAPQPDTWDQFIISYYPFADSEKARPGSCNLTSRSLSSAQSLVLNIELCGQAGSETFPSQCQKPWSRCSRKSSAGKGDCCTEYMTDPAKSDEALARDGFFNISYIKIWQEQQVTPASNVDEVIV